jgi:hypothetical protein
VALVELPRRAASNLMESGRWPRRSTSALAATAVLRPLDADEVRHKIALLAGGVEAIAAVCFLHSRRARVSRYRSLIVGQNGAGAAPYESATRSSPTLSCNH